MDDIDIIMMYFARTLSEYCDNRDCEGCPFDDPNVKTGHCSIGTPAYWDIDEPLDFPNSN